MASSDMTSAAAPSQEELEDIILSARYGELEEIQEFVKRYGNDSIASARDERGNTCLHMAAANGHAGADGFISVLLAGARGACSLTLKFWALWTASTDVLSFLLPILPADALVCVNESNNTPLHWAALNGHLAALRLLVPAVPRSSLFFKNTFGRTALSEAENGAQHAGANTESPEKSPQMECAGYLLTFMELENEKREAPKEGQGEAEAGGSASTPDGGEGEDDEGEEVTLGVARMGVASKTGDFEFEEQRQ